MFTVAAAFGFKWYLRTRHDFRTDQQGVVDRDAHRRLAESYDLLVVQLREEISRLREELSRLREELSHMATRMKDISKLLDSERVTRQQSDKRADTLQLRVGELEHQLKALGDMP